MVRSLAPCTVTASSIFQTQMDYRTGETVITANGQRIMACSTKQEAEDMIVYLNDRKPGRTVTPLTAPMPSLDEIFGA